MEEQHKEEVLVVQEVLEQLIKVMLVAVVLLVITLQQVVVVLEQLDNLNNLQRLQEMEVLFYAMGAVPYFGQNLTFIYIRTILRQPVQKLKSCGQWKDSAEDLNIRLFSS